MAEHPTPQQSHLLVKSLPSRLQQVFGMQPRVGGFLGFAPEVTGFLQRGEAALFGFPAVFLRLQHRL